MAREKSRGFRGCESLTTCIRHFALKPLLVEKKRSGQKSEAILLVGRKKVEVEKMVIRVEGHPIEPKREVKYLGVVLDQGLTSSPHVEYVVKKAAKAATARGKIVPRIGGAGGARRRLLATVAESIVLYAAPVWKDALKKKINQQKVASVQRVLALWICRAYRTVGTDAALVIADSIPWDLKAEERAERLAEDGGTAKEIRPQ